ncbi:MAG TPA: hypothetical protein VF802_01395, partial [Candidatus Limnocylindrales bacterium]
LQLLPLAALSTKTVSALALRRAAERNALRAVRRPTGWYSTKTWVSAYTKNRGKRRAIAGWRDLASAHDLPGGEVVLISTVISEAD